MTHQINISRLRRLPPHPIGTNHPGLPVDTKMLARFLRLSVPHLLKLHRLGIGPVSLPQGRFNGNHLYWRLADGLSWWLSVARPERAQTADEIIADWKSENALLLQAHPKWAIVADWSRHMSDKVCLTEGACQAFRCGARCAAPDILDAVLPKLGARFRRRKDRPYFDA